MHPLIGHVMRQTTHPLLRLTSARPPPPAARDLATPPRVPAIDPRLRHEPRREDCAACAALRRALGWRD